MGRLVPLRGGCFSRRLGRVFCIAKNHIGALPWQRLGVLQLQEIDQFLSHLAAQIEGVAARAVWIWSIKGSIKARNAQ